MTDSLFSTMWYRVCEHRPRLRAEVRVQRQWIRGQLWYLLLNEANNHQLRINDQAYKFIARCDGVQTVQQIWDVLVASAGDEAPTQGEVIAVLNQLDQHECFTQSMLLDATDGDRARRPNRRMQEFVNPFALRIPLGDPTPLLKRIGRLPRLLFNPVTLVMWLIGVAMAAIAVVANWEELSSHAAAYMTSPRYVLLAWLCFPLMKAFHELAHALAIRRWGGQVHGAGFSLFVLVPAPYVDASAAALFPARYQRAIVDAAGMMVELAIASAALAIWCNVQPGMVRDIAFVTMFIGSVSTIIFNANPLLRFDGYHLVCDLFNLPNLGVRSRAWWSATVLHWMVRRTREPMSIAEGELKWLLLYQPLSISYRIVISGVLVLWLGSYSTVAGAVSAVFFLWILIAKPVLSGLANVRAQASETGLRWGSALATIAAAASLFVAPLPFHTVAIGVVWPPEQARVRIATDGFIQQLVARDGDHVTAGQLLMVMDDPSLFTQREKLAMRFQQLEAGRYAALFGSPERTQSLEEELVRIQSDLRRVDQKIADLEVRATGDGTLVIPHQQDLKGTYLPQGSTVAYVIQQAGTSVRAAVAEYDAALLRHTVKNIAVRIAGDNQSYDARFVRDIPAATYELPSPALGDRGGGPLVTDSDDKDGTRSKEPIVLVDVMVPSKALERIGSRAWVRFDHGLEPLMMRAYRQARQLFLQHFNAAA